MNKPVRRCRIYISNCIKIDKNLFLIRLMKTLLFNTGIANTTRRLHRQHLLAQYQHDNAKQQQASRVYQSHRSILNPNTYLAILTLKAINTDTPQVLFGAYTAGSQQQAKTVSAITSQTCLKTHFPLQEMPKI